MKSGKPAAAPRAGIPGDRHAQQESPAHEVRPHARQGTREAGEGRIPVPAQEEVRRTDARARAEQHLADSATARYGIYTDTKAKPGFVAIGLAIRGVGSCLIAMEASEYDPMRILEMLP